MRAVLMVVQVFASLAIIGLVLIQRGKGADAGAGFGSGASGTVFGARGATTTLSRATAICAAVFMLCSLALAYLGAQQTAAPKTLLDQMAEQQQPATHTNAPPLLAPQSSLPQSSSPQSSLPQTLPAPAAPTGGSQSPVPTKPVPATPAK